MTIQSQPALGLIETNSIARGIVSLDAMVKKAKINVLQSHPVCPGKYIILISGSVAEVEESMEVGKYYSGHTLVDTFFLPNAHSQLAPAISGTTNVDEITSVGIIETYSVASTILAGDTAVKTAKVNLLEMRLAMGLGGKSFFTMTGDLYDVEAAVEAGAGRIDGGLLVTKEIIPAPHNEMKGFIV